MNKETRLKVYGKYGGHCAYCGRRIELKDMQVDHIVPKHVGGKDELSNYNPACRRCNHYKTTFDIEYFRETIKTLHERVMNAFISKVAEDYGIIEIKEWDGKFYFERVGDTT
jgi:CRISPR/Cas system Type II protein with McrA/HNH and RuvC-like nuclease domain